MRDLVTLSVPRDAVYGGVLRLVLAGLGTRLDLPLEQTDELQLAVEALLEGDGPAAALALEAEVFPRLLAVRLGPFAPGTASEPSLRRVLDALVTSAHSLERDEDEWIELHVERTIAEASVG